MIGPKVPAKKCHACTGRDELKEKLQHRFILSVKAAEANGRSNQSLSCVKLHIKHVRAHAPKCKITGGALAAAGLGSEPAFAAVSACWAQFASFTDTGGTGKHTEPSRWA